MNKDQRAKKKLEKNIEKIASKLVKLTGLNSNDKIIIDGDVDNCIMIYDPKMETSSERFSELADIITGLIKEEFPEMEDRMNIENHGNSCGIYF